MSIEDVSHFVQSGIQKAQEAPAEAIRTHIEAASAAEVITTIEDALGALSVRLVETDKAQAGLEDGTSKGNAAHSILRSASRESGSRGLRDARDNAELMAAGMRSQLMRVHTMREAAEEARDHLAAARRLLAGKYSGRKTWRLKAL